MSKMMRRGSRGFTLIEMLIVIVVIAILALIVIPRLLGAGRKAKEAALKGDLHMLRNGIQQFEADTGVYPGALADLQSKPASLTGADLTAWQGPYLQSIPADPFGGAAWTYAADPGDASVMTVHSASTTVPLDGVGTYALW
jgi:general secretion pathway protein G